jgi:hypothetical protein
MLQVLTDFNIVDVNAKAYEGGNTLLHIAAKECDPKVTKFLLKGSILQNSISAEKFSDKYLSSNFEQITTTNFTFKFI